MVVHCWTLSFLLLSLPFGLGFHPYWPLLPLDWSANTGAHDHSYAGSCTEPPSLLQLPQVLLQLQRVPHMGPTPAHAACPCHHSTAPTPRGSCPHWPSWPCSCSSLAPAATTTPAMVPLPPCPCSSSHWCSTCPMQQVPPKGQCNGALASPLLVDSPTLPHPRMGQSKNAMQNARGIFDLHTILYLLRHHLNPVSILLFLSIPWREQRYSQYHKWFVQMLFFCNSNGNTMASICKSYLTLTKTQR